MTQEEAIALAKTGFWKDMSARDVAIFQLSELRLCMPFDVFHAALEEALGRPVFTHEMAWPQALLRELLGEKPAPSLSEIMDLVPADKRVVVVKT